MLAELSGTVVDHLVSPDATTSLPFSVASKDGRHHMVFRKLPLAARRYEAARLLAGTTIQPSRKVVLASEAITEEQLMQRAFAAELLVPLEALKDQFDGNFSPNAIERVADLFMVSPMIVQSHWSSAED